MKKTPRWLNDEGVEGRANWEQAMYLPFELRKYTNVTKLDGTTADFGAGDTAINKPLPRSP